MVLDFLATPRSFGSPKQVWDNQGNPVVHSKSKLVKLINQNNNGVNDVFVSHNRFMSFVDRKPFTIEVSKIFLDFDTKLKAAPSDALDDVRQVIDFLDELNLPFLPVFSGSKGLHVYIPIKEKIYTAGSYLTDMTRACMLYLKRELGLQTIDPKVATPTKLCRVIYSIHPKTKLHCTPLNPEWVRAWNIDQIMDYARKPNGWHCDLLNGKKYLNLDELVEYAGINVGEEISHGREQFALESENLKFLSPDDEFLAQLLHLPCLINSLIGVENAVHPARFAGCVHLKNLGYSPAWIFKFFKQRCYLDSHLEAECRYQINYIFGKNFSNPSCRWYQENNLCVGKNCKYYKR